MLQRPSSSAVAGFRLAAEGDGDGFMRRGHAPDVNWQAALHHHVIGEQRRQGDVGAN